jgi:hypothetical protein
MANIARDVESAETVTPPQERSRTHDELPAVAESGAAKARIKLESLPALLRAVVSGVSDTGITIEAELPWLAVGTAVHADCPDGVGYDARVQRFDLDVTSSGAARLRIFAALSSEQPGAPEAHRPRHATRPRVRRAFALAAFMAIALLCSSLG